METINIYSINLNPCGPDKNASLQKSDIVNSVFHHYKEKSRIPCEMGKVVMFSFRPKDTNGYTAFIEEFINKKVQKPCILIFKSLMDITNLPKTACVRLKNLINQDGIRAVYFSDYSADCDASTYLVQLAGTFNVEIDFSERKKRKSLYPEALKNKIRRLRIVEPPVLYSDLSEITGISESTLRSMVNPPNTQGTRGPNGRHITEDEKAELKSIMESVEWEIFHSVDLFPEEYIR